MKDLIPVYYDSLTEKEKQELPKVPTFNPRVHRVPVNWEGKFDKSQIIKKENQNEILSRNEIKMQN